MTNSYTNTALLDRNRPRKVVFYGRVSTEHEAQLSALENQMEWYEDIAKRFPNWTVVDRYIDEGITGTQAKKRPSFMKMIADSKTDKFDLIVTREVCRFARNTVDTLTHTRELKNRDIEVYFVDDNIWTMDGDGELRLTIMATLAQEESRKVSERVKAGQHISREKKILYGCGNILGYDLKRNIGEDGKWNPSENTYVINPEQAETVQMIFKMYASGMGGMKIAKELTKSKRYNASGIVKWDAGTIMRIIGNATYKGYICYNKSRSNNFLEQKRINNYDASTYILVKGDFEPIVSEELWDSCNAIRKSKSKPSLVENGQVKKISHRTTRDLWQDKLRCKCGSSFRKDIWHRKKDGTVVHGYSCYNRVNNGSAADREKQHLDTDGYCDMKMVCDWKLDLMADELLNKMWVTRQDDMDTALSLIRKYYKSELDSSNVISAEFVQAQREKLERKKKNILNMRAENEISKEECAEMKKELEADFAKLDAQEQNISSQQNLQDDMFANLAQIEHTLKGLADLTDRKLTHDFLGEIIESVIPQDNEHFIWDVHCDTNRNQKLLCSVGGRKNKAVVSIDEVLEASEGDEPSVHIKSSLPEKLHRLLLSRSSHSQIALTWDFTVTYEMAKAWRKAHAAYLRQGQWQDITMRICIDVG